MPASWTDASFLEEAEAWTRARLEELGTPVTGRLEQPHVRWWSTVLRVPTTAADAWFKAVQREYLHEVPLTQVLAKLHGELLPSVLAVDEVRGWMLLGDAGTRLRELDDGRSAVDHWEALLPRYAELQIAAAPHVVTLLDDEVPDLRLASLPGRLAALLDEPELLMLGQPGGLSSEEHRQLRAGIDDFADACSRLAALGIPETVQHDDLHDGNVFVRDGRHVVIDWGDACISHPFHSLAVALRAGAYRHGWKPGGPEIRRLLAAYGAPWRGLGAGPEVGSALELARRTGAVQRSLAWAAALRAMPRETWGDEVQSISYGLRLHLLDGAWGTWDDGSF